MREKIKKCFGAVKKRSKALAMCAVVTCAVGLTVAPTYALTTGDTPVETAIETYDEAKYYNNLMKAFDDGIDDVRNMAGSINLKMTTAGVVIIGMSAASGLILKKTRGITRKA